jgi:Flp pilus assembly protein TadD
MHRGHCAAAEKILGYLERGTAYLKMGQASKALADYDMAASIFPRDSVILFGRGLARAMLGDSAGADADRDQALKLNGDAATWFRLRGISIPQPVKT